MENHSPYVCAWLYLKTMPVWVVVQLKVVSVLLTFSKTSAAISCRIMKPSADSLQAQNERWLPGEGWCLHHALKISVDQKEAVRSSLV